jgi:homoserine acetyltransferase
VDRFDANSYLYITRAIDLFNLARSGDGSLMTAFENVQANYLVVSFTPTGSIQRHVQGDRERPQGPTARM